MGQTGSTLESALREALDVFLAKSTASKRTQAVRRVWKTVDVNKNGILDKDEALRLLNALVNQVKRLKREMLPQLQRRHSDEKAQKADEENLSIYDRLKINSGHDRLQDDLQAVNLSELPDTARVVDAFLEGIDFYKNGRITHNEFSLWAVHTLHNPIAEVRRLFRQPFSGKTVDDGGGLADRRSTSDDPGQNASAFDAADGTAPYLDIASPESKSPKASAPAGPSSERSFSSRNNSGGWTPRGMSSSRSIRSVETSMSRLSSPHALVSFSVWGMRVQTKFGGGVITDGDTPQAVTKVHLDWGGTAFFVLNRSRALAASPLGPGPTTAGSGEIDMPPAQRRRPRLRSHFHSRDSATPEQPESGGGTTKLRLERAKSADGEPRKQRRTREAKRVAMNFRIHIDNKSIQLRHLSPSKRRSMTPDPTNGTPSVAAGSRRDGGKKRRNRAKVSLEIDHFTFVRGSDFGAVDSIPGHLQLRHNSVELDYPAARSRWDFSRRATPLRLRRSLRETDKDMRLIHRLCLETIDDRLVDSLSNKQVLRTLPLLLMRRHGAVLRLLQSDVDLTRRAFWTMNCVPGLVHSEYTRFVMSTAPTAILSRTLRFFQRDFELGETHSNLDIFCPLFPARTVSEVRIVKKFTSGHGPMLAEMRFNGLPSLPVDVIYKPDDCRADAACVSMFRFFNQVWEAACLDPLPYAYTWDICPLDAKSGLMEFIGNSCELQVWDLDKILDLTPEDLLEFVRSAAGSYVACYIMGCRDRHKSNFLIKDGHTFLQIDFKHCFDWKTVMDAPHFAIQRGMRRNFKQRGVWKLFKKLCVAAFRALRRLSQPLIRLALRAFTGLWYEPARMEAWMVKSFRLGETEEQACRAIPKLINAGIASLKKKIKSWTHKQSLARHRRRERRQRMDSKIVTKPARDSLELPTAPIVDPSDLDTSRSVSPETRKMPSQRSQSHDGRWMRYRHTRRLSLPRGSEQLALMRLVAGQKGAEGVNAPPRSTPTPLQRPPA